MFQKETLNEVQRQEVCHMAYGMFVLNLSGLLPNACGIY